MVHRVRLSELSAEITTPCEELNRLAAHIERYLAHEGDPEQPVPALVVMDLRHYYIGVEAVLVGVARMVDGQVPQDPHGLVALMSEEVREVRPAVIDGPLGRFVLGLHGLRDAYREGHPVHLEPDELEHYAEQVVEHHALFQGRVLRLLDFLAARER